MHVDDLENLISCEKSNIIKLVELEIGRTLPDEPHEVVELLQSRLEDSVKSGVSYGDIAKLKQLTVFNALTEHLNPEDYPHKPTLVGVVEYRNVLKACIKVLTK